MAKLVPPEPPPVPEHLRCLCVQHVHVYSNATCSAAAMDRLAFGYETGFQQIWPTCPQHGWAHDWSTPEGMAAATWLLIVGHVTFKADPCRLSEVMREQTRAQPALSCAR